jgi:pyruvate/2-oxoglutarate dehydrogenase complex dihydrolipoamide dehydrogenase (E3) component
MDFGKEALRPRSISDARWKLVFAGGAERGPAKLAKDAKYGHLLGGHVAGNGAGILVNGEITPLAAVRSAEVGRVNSEIRHTLRRRLHRL